MKKKNSFIVLSDFHSIKYPLEKIKKYYINEYEYIYILGDCMDRGTDGIGTGGIDILYEIMSLSEKYPNRIKYVPGNHDNMLLLALHKGGSYKIHLQQNGGENTINECIMLKEVNPNKYNKLINWLMHQPIQRIHKYKGKTYVMAHAFFNQKIYESNPDYNLKDFLFETDIKKQKKVEQILWFRNGKYYDRNDLPTYEATMVVGHTPTDLEYNSKLELENSLGKKIKVQCVDGGITYSGTMLKYVGGPTAEKTYIGEHYYREQEDEIINNNKTEINLKKDLIKQHFNYIKQNKKLNITEAYNDFLKSKDLYKDEYIEIINKYNIVGDKTSIKFCMFSLTTIFDFIIINIIKKYDSADLSFILENINNFIFKNYENYNYFTRDNNVRVFAQYLGKENMALILTVYNCSNINEYIEYKFPNAKRKKL